MSVIDVVKRHGRPVRRWLQTLPSKYYSQYGEDAFVFSAMKPGRKGFYVDIGAYDPVEGSNTYKLYKKGWRGITVEPNPKATWKFKLIRPGDTHLEMGISAAPSTLTYHEFEISMLNTMDAERARSLEQDGHKILRTREIRCDTMKTIIAENAAGRQIDLLNIDCEGADMEVLLSLDLTSNRPTVILMEDLEGYFGLGEGADSAVMRFMREHDYAPIARLAYSSVFIALDWRDLNRRSGAYREAAIHPNLLPERAAEAVSA